MFRRRERILFLIIFRHLLHLQKVVRLCVTSGIEELEKLVLVVGIVLFCKLIKEPIFLTY